MQTLSTQIGSLMEENEKREKELELRASALESVVVDIEQLKQSQAGLVSAMGSLELKQSRFTQDISRKVT